MLIAITRAVSDSLASCELTHLARAPIDVTRAREQHGAYEEALRSLGVTVVRAAEAPDLPDAVFVEDTAVVLDELAIITRPGAPSRRAETAGVAAVLGAYRPLIHLNAPATLDGGDVLRIGRRLLVGQTARTNSQGIEELQRIAEPLGYRIAVVRVVGCLHLKSAITCVAESVVLMNPAWLPGIDAELAGLERLEVDSSEPYGANALRVGESVIYPAHFPRTRQCLEARGLAVKAVACEELAKAEGAVTCCSILVDAL